MSTASPLVGVCDMLNTMVAKLITIQGSARGGKGTLARALTDDLSTNYRVYKIDQGLKFRIVAKKALETGLDIENLDELNNFVTQAETRTTVANQLRETASWDKAQLEKEYYTAAVSNASGMVGKLPSSQDLLVALLGDEIHGLSHDYDIIIVDGRALQAKGAALAQDGAVEYLLAIDVHCDAFVSAQRETNIFAPQDEHELSGYTREQALELLVATRDIARRNTSDARRACYPSLPLVGAYEFDVLHDTSEAEWLSLVENVQKTKAISVDNSATRTPEQLTCPVVRLVRGLLTLKCA